MEDKNCFFEIRDKLIRMFPEAQPGNMMGSPAITKKGKVFCFFSKKNKMVFKLGDIHSEDFSFSISEFQPFKTKRPLRGWWEVSYADSSHWEKLATQALTHCKNKSK